MAVCMFQLEPYPKYAVTDDSAQKGVLALVLTLAQALHARLETASMLIPTVASMVNRSMHD